jgi:hypothetical protein
MSVRGFALRIAVPAVVTALISSCGGGGYGGSSGGMGGGGMGGGYGGNAQMPTVKFTSPSQATAVNLGQGVQLAWTSTNATSCTATMSSMMGGNFTGSQPTSGKATVAPTGTGSVMYTLNCSGSGGMASAISPVVTVNAPILSTLSKITTIGSTIDPVEKGGNPYGLAIAPATAGLITVGDLIVCNFNDGATNTQGLGTTIVGLHPTSGAVPYRIAQSPALRGCDALAILPDGSISAAAYSADQNPLVAPSGLVGTPFSSDSFASPWGEAYAPAMGANSAALYVSNADGSIDRITLTGDTQDTFTQIITGFCGSGMPGAVFAPAGLTYDPSIDTLYVVDTSSNSVVAFANVSKTPAAGVVVNGQCKSVAAPPTPAPTFSGPSASSARVIAHGGPLIAPLSAALLADGDLIVANSDINLAAGQTPNLVVEVSPVVPGGFVGNAMQLDAGAPGALFGVAATVDPQGNQIVYFNDDNANAVMMLTK